MPLSPSFLGAPAWPGQRQAWRVIRRSGGRTLLVTNGLSDPSLEHEKPSLGFGLELALEIDEPVKNVQGNWALQLLQRVADEVAEHEQVRKAALAGLLSMEVSGKGMPKSLVSAEAGGACYSGWRRARYRATSQRLPGR